MGAAKMLTPKLTGGDYSRKGVPDGPNGRTLTTDGPNGYTLSTDGPLDVP